MAMNMKNSMGKQYKPYGAGKGQWQQDRYQSSGAPYFPSNTEWTASTWQKPEGDKGMGKDKGKGKGKGKKNKKGNKGRVDGDNHPLRQRSRVGKTCFTKFWGNRLNYGWGALVRH